MHEQNARYLQKTRDARVEAAMSKLLGRPWDPFAPGAGSQGPGETLSAPELTELRRKLRELVERFEADADALLRPADGTDAGPTEGLKRITVYLGRSSEIA